MRESRSSGSVEGVMGNHGSYSDCCGHGLLGPGSALEPLAPGNGTGLAVSRIEETRQKTSVPGTAAILTPRPASGTLRAMTVPRGATPAILRTLTLGSADWETRGVLRPGSQPPGSPLRFAPADDMSAFVDLYWIASWELAPGQTLLVETLPHPCVNVVVEPGRSRVHGPVKGRFSRTLAGRGRVVSARLRPGAFRAFAKQPAWRLVDATIDFPEAFGVASGPLERTILGQPDERRMVAALEQFLRERLPVAAPAARAAPAEPRDPADTGSSADPPAAVHAALDGFVDLAELVERIERIDRIIGRIAGDRDLVKVEDLAQGMGMGRRSLERLFRDYVGLSPKWVIRQYRLQIAADEAAKGRVVDWPRLANDLGYADQAHFIRDFRAVLGTTPAEFARQASPGPA